MCMYICSSSWYNLMKVTLRCICNCCSLLGSHFLFLVYHFYLCNHTTYVQPCLHTYVHLYVHMHDSITMNKLRTCIYIRKLTNKTNCAYIMNSDTAVVLTHHLLCWNFQGSMYISLTEISCDLPWNHEIN